MATNSFFDCGVATRYEVADDIARLMEIKGFTEPEIEFVRTAIIEHLIEFYFQPIKNRLPEVKDHHEKAELLYSEILEIIKHLLERQLKIPQKICNAIGEYIFIKYVLPKDSEVMLLFEYKIQIFNKC